MEYKEDIEQLFKNTFDNFEADVHPDAWVNIQNGLNVPPVSNPASGINSISAGAKLTAVSSKLIIMATTAIIGITTAVVYFSFNNETQKANPSNETKIAQNIAPVAVQSNAENKNVTEAENVKKEKQPVSSNEIPENKNENLQLSKEGSAYSSSTSEDVSVAEMKKKNSAEIIESKTKVADEKLQNKPDQAALLVADEMKSKDNSSEENATSNQNADEVKSSVADVKEEKNIEEYLGKIPNVITPNGDGDNDVFVIEGKDIKTLKVSIIDRSGKIIHHWNNLHGFWDGKLANGEPAKTGTYFYDIFAQTTSGSPLNKKGTIHVLLK